MIAFLLGLLKVIGIILLVVLILLLVIVGIVLFVPIRYGGTGQITEEKKEVSARVTWLLKAVQCGVDYTFPEKPIIIVRVLGIDIMKLLEKQSNKEGQSSDAAQDNKTTSIKAEKKKPAKKTVPGVNTSLLDEPASEPAEPKEVVEIPKNAPQELGKDSKKEPTKIQTIIDKIKDIIYNINYYLAILQEEDTKQLIANAWDAILKILKSICPKEFKLTGRFGFATPDTTGKVYGMYAVVMPILGDHVVLEPDFEQQVIQGEVALKGRITIFVIVVNALKILFDKRLQPLIKKLKRGGNKNGR